MSEEAIGIPYRKIEDPPFRTARTLLTQCPAGRELLKVALQRDIRFVLFHHSMVVDHGSYSTASGHPVIELKVVRNPHHFASILVHELEHAQQDSAGVLQPEPPAQLDAESLSLARRTILVAEAGAMAKVALVLCQLRDAGYEQPLVRMTNDDQCGYLVRHCQVLQKLDPGSLYDGRAFRAVAADYCSRADMVASAVAQAAWQWAAPLGASVADQLAELHYHRYLDEPGYRALVQAEFQATLATLVDSSAAPPEEGARVREPADIHGEAALALHGRLHGLQYPPVASQPVLPGPAWGRERELEPTQ